MYTYLYVNIWVHGGIASNSRSQGKQLQEKEIIS